MQAALLRFTLSDLISSLCTDIFVELIEMLPTITIRTNLQLESVAKLVTR